MRLFFFEQSDFIFVAFSVTREIGVEIKGKEESCSFEENHGKKEFELVIKRVAREDKLAVFSPDNASQSSQDKWKKPAPRSKWKEVSRTVEELGMQAEDKKGTWVKSL